MQGRASRGRLHITFIIGHDTAAACHGGDMASLSPASKTALANLRASTFRSTNWYRCPLSRRAAVLILLFADRGGDLRVVLTIRSAGLRNYAGQPALPGGKSDTLAETPFMVARREAFEEIGLPMDDKQLPAGYSVEHLTELPANLAMTELGVRPCVAYLKTPSPSPQNRHPDVTRDILPRLDAREVAAVFTAPFRNFLYEQDLDAETRARVPGEWYRGSWHSWHETAWRMHQFFVPVTPATVFLAKKPDSYTDPRPRASSHSQQNTTTTTTTTTPTRPKPSPSSTSSSSSSSSSLQPPLPRTFYTNSNSPTNSALHQQQQQQSQRYRVFGMTARILVDAARVAYAQEPEYEHNSHFGDEEMIANLLRIGRLGERRTPGETLTRKVIQQAATAAKAATTPKM